MRSVLTDNKSRDLQNKEIQTNNSHEWRYENPLQMISKSNSTVYKNDDK